MSTSQVDESQLRHPWERPIFIVSVVVNLAILIAAVIVVSMSPHWLKHHPILSSSIKQMRGLAMAAVFALPAIVVIRNIRRGFIRGNAIRLSAVQMGIVYKALEHQCAKLGMEYVPDLYLADPAIHGPAEAFSAWHRDYIVLTSQFIDSKPERTIDVISYALGCELGRIRLGHTKWWYEMLLSYIVRVPYISNPIRQVQILSRDRYGAFLAPDGVLRGLIIQASGRRILDQVDGQEVLQRAMRPGGFWFRLADLSRKTPHLAYRIRALTQAGLLAPPSNAEPPAEELPAKEKSHYVQ
jgi:hypothetical protein